MIGGAIARMIRFRDPPHDHEVLRIAFRLTNVSLAI